MSNYLNYTSDKFDIFMFLLDSSGSMSDDRKNVRDGLELFKESFNHFDEVNSIGVSFSSFADDFYPREFCKVSDLYTNFYDTDGATALFYSIEKGAEYLNGYINEVITKTHVTPKSTFIVFSDGEPCRDRRSYNDAKKAISNLNYQGITTGFVAFGSAIHSSFGKDLGFMATIDVNNRESLKHFLGFELSQSLKEQSKSMKALGANFFSKAMNNSASAGYSATTAQALDDDSFIDDI